MLIDSARGRRALLPILGLLVVILVAGCQRTAAVDWEPWTPCRVELYRCTAESRVGRVRATGQWIAEYRLRWEDGREAVIEIGGAGD